MNKFINLSPLPHTWILDFDGTLVEHNGYKTGEDKWLPGALEFLKSIPQEDYVLILTARFNAIFLKFCSDSRSQYQRNQINSCHYMVVISQPRVGRF